MVDLKDGTLSKQKAQYVDHKPVKRGNTDYLELSYKNLDSDNPEEIRKTGAFLSQLDQQSLDLIKNKGEFVVVKVKAGKFWNLQKIEDISTYTPKEPKTYAGGGQRTYTAKAATSTAYNTAGIKVGAILHDAVSILGVAPMDGINDHLKQLKGVAEKLLTLSFELEANVNAGKYEPKTKSTSNLEPIPQDEIDY